MFFVSQPPDIGLCVTGLLNMGRVSEEVKVEGDVGASGLDRVTVGGVM